MIALRADAIHAFYGKSHILHGVSLEVREGEIVALLGRNGAGKTTTLRCLIGLTRPRTGSVALFGADVTGFPPYRIAEAGRRLCAGGATHLRQSDCGREPPGPGRAAGPVDGQARLRGLPAPRRAQDQQGRPALGRRAGDAVDRPRADLEPEAAHARRALAGPRAVDRRGCVQNCRRGAARRRLGPPGRAERARRGRDRRPRLCARRREDRLRGRRAEFGADEKRVRELAGASAEKWDMDG